VQFLEAGDAAEAQYNLDHQVIGGREVTVVFAEENRKKPQEMRSKERIRGRPGYHGRRRSPYGGKTSSSVQMSLEVSLVCPVDISIGEHLSSNL
jgi:hypothetical protein